VAARLPTLNILSQPSFLLSLSISSEMAPQDANISDENTPLLAAPHLPINEEAVIGEGESNGKGTTTSNGGYSEEDPEKPLPKLQVFLLCYARMIEPMAFFGIFPFIPKMIQQVGNLEEADIGFYAGLIVCSFHFLTVFVY
jgi:hypothetical protein